MITGKDFIPPVRGGPGGHAHHAHVAPKMADHAEGGFDCEFVEKPAKGVQSECPVCLLVLKEPYQVTCCGYGFCRVCIERVRANNRGKPCPCCKAYRFDCFEDKGRKRLLNDYQVHCANKKQGCQWVGELGEHGLKVISISSHLKTSSWKAANLHEFSVFTAPSLFCVLV